MRCSSSPTIAICPDNPLYCQLFDQLRQWVKPEDRRHLQGYAEIMSAILQSGSACLSHWLPYLQVRLATGQQ